MAINNVRNMMRLTGMSSGLDTQSIVDSLMKLEQMKVDKQWKARTRMETKRDAYRDVSTTLQNFRNDNLSVLNKMNNLLTASNYNVKKVTSENAGNAVSFSATSDATVGAVTVNYISEIASGASVKGSTLAPTDTPISVHTKLSDMAQYGLQMDADTNTLAFNINGKEFTFKGDDTLQTMMNKVNADSTANVQMSFSQLTNSFTITSKKTGADSAINITNVAGNAFAETGAGGLGIDMASVTAGKNAVLSINGTEISRSSNNFTVDGITYNLKARSTTEINLNVEQDIDAGVTMVKKFVDAYNTMVDKFNGLLSETYYKTFDPLTDDERAVLTDKQQEDWDKKAKSGLLRNDAGLTGFLDGMRSAFYSQIEGIGKTMSDIGIKTGSYQDKGKLTIDETQLRKALAENPNEVAEMFTRSSTSTNKSEKIAQSGIAYRISEYIGTYSSNLKSTSISGMDKQISQANSKISDMEERMASYEERLWKKYSALEAAMSKMNSQQSSIQGLYNL